MIGENYLVALNLSVAIVTPRFCYLVLFVLPPSTEWTAPCVDKPDLSSLQQPGKSVSSITAAGSGV
jgi:hypothetical protein